MIMGVQMDCEVSEEAVAGLRREYETLVNAGFADTHEWLDSEDQLLEKVPQLSRDSIRVRPHRTHIPSSFVADVSVSCRAGKPSTATTEDGSPPPRPSMQ